jgi:hypothetical protein
MPLANKIQSKVEQPRKKHLCVAANHAAAGSASRPLRNSFMHKCHSVIMVNAPIYLGRMLVTKRVIMSVSKKVVVFFAGIGMLSTPFFGAAAEAMTKKHHRHGVHHFSQPRPMYRRSVDGDLVDNNGWRLRDGTWDNTCFNLDYLPSEFACSARGRR